MRNQPKPLRPDEWERVRGMVDKLAQAFAYEEPVTLVYEKRNGRMSSSTGFVDSFPGKAGFDTFSVKVITADKGPRTINLKGVREIH